jgi:threonine synthase
MSGEDEKTTARLMMELSKQGCYNVSRSTLAGITSLFWSDWSSEDETRAAIAGVWKESRYLIDPHTAVGIDVYDKYVISTGDMTPTVAVATASPFKFNRSVAESIADADDPALRDKLAAVNEFELLHLLSASTGCRVPASLATLESRPVLHNRVCATVRMKEEVQNFLTGSLGSEPAAF